jgi:hypothetical protein
MFAEQIIPALKRFCPEGQSASPFSSSYFARSGEVLSLECPRESTQREGHPGALIGCADPLRSSPLRGRAQKGR